MDNQSTRSAAWNACLLVGIGLAVHGFGNEPRHEHRTSPTPPSGSQAPAALSLGDLEQMALQGNPTLTQAAAAIDASRGKALQAGLYPNPSIGYVGEQIGIAGTAGELQGAFVQQTIVTAGKLRLSRAKYNQTAYEAETRAVGQQYRIRNGLQLKH